MVLAICSVARFGMFPSCAIVTMLRMKIHRRIQSTVVTVIYCCGNSIPAAQAIAPMTTVTVATKSRSLCNGRSLCTKKSRMPASGQRDDCRSQQRCLCAVRKNGNASFTQPFGIVPHFDPSTVTPVCSVCCLGNSHALLRFCSCAIVEN
jgi:hypothetical protein